MKTLDLNRHAEVRGAQRNVSAEEINYIVDHGQRFHKAGALIYFLRRRDVPDDDRRNDQFMRLEGTAVILNKKGERVITVWRNRRKGLKRIKRKSKWARTAQRRKPCLT